MYAESLENTSRIIKIRQYDGRACFFEFFPGMASANKADSINDTCVNGSFNVAPCITNDMDVRVVRLESCAFTSRHDQLTSVFMRVITKTADSEVIPNADVK